MQWMYVLQLQPKYTQPQNWTDDANRIVGEHFNYLTALFKQGVVKFVGKTEYGIEHPHNRGLAVFEAEDEAAATAIMQADPCILNGVMTAELHPFRVVFSSGQ